MSLPDLFGDDQHTALEDAYSRAMKCRKWVILSAVAYFVVHHSAFAPVSFTVLVGRATVTSRAFDLATQAGLAYICIQYGLLLTQLAVRYRRIVSERFGLREFARRLELERAHNSLIDEHQRLGELLKGPTLTLAAAGMTADSITRRMKQLSADIEQSETSIGETVETPERPTFLYVACEVVIDLARLLSPIAATIAVTSGVGAQSFT